MTDFRDFIPEGEDTGASTNVVFQDFVPGPEIEETPTEDVQTDENQPKEEEVAPKKRRSRK